MNQWLLRDGGGSIGEEEVDEAAMRLEVREADDGERTWSLNAPKFCWSFDESKRDSFTGI